MDQRAEPSGTVNCSVGPGKDEFSVAVYECSSCCYRTVNKSNLNTHLKTKCVGGGVQKRRGIVRVLDLETPRAKDPSQPLSQKAMEDNNKLRLRKAMDGRTSLGDTDERVTFFIYLEEGRRILMDIYSKESLMDQFLYFIKYYTGNAAPLKCRSIARYGSKGGSLVVVRDLGLTYPSLRRCTIVDLLIELYAKFKYVCEQPVYRDDVPRGMRDAAGVFVRKLDQPLDRTAKKRTLTLKEILDTRRGDDDVMNILIGQFPLCLSFVDPT